MKATKELKPDLARVLLEGGRIVDVDTAVRRSLEREASQCEAEAIDVLNRRFGELVRMLFEKGQFRESDVESLINYQAEFKDIDRNEF